MRRDAREKLAERSTVKLLRDYERAVTLAAWMKPRLERACARKRVVRDLARWWVKGDGVAYTTANELTSCAAFWRNVDEAARVRLKRSKDASDAT